MKFSVIIPTYNRSHLILKTIQSVLAQTYEDFEVIVVDDGSTDNTEDVVKSIENPRLTYYKKENAERGAARNFGILKANGEYVNCLDSDDLVYPDHIKTAKETIDKLMNPEVIHLGYEVRNTKSKIIKRCNNLPETANMLLIKGNVLSCDGVFIRTDVARQNLFNENRVLSALEDWELWLRLASQFPFHCNNSITSVIINHDERSVLLTEKGKLIQRFDALFELVLQNPVITRYYKGNINVFESYCYTYIALHLALTKKYKSDTFRYLIKGIMESPSSIFSRRFLAILKHLVM